MKATSATTPSCGGDYFPNTPEQVYSWYSMPPNNLPGIPQPHTSSQDGPVDIARQHGSNIAPALRTPEVDSSRQHPLSSAPVHVAISAATESRDPSTGSSAGPNILGPIPQRPVVSSVQPAPAAPRQTRPDSSATLQSNAKEPTIPELIAAAEADIRRVMEEREKLEQHTAELVRERKSVEAGIAPLREELDRINARLADIEHAERAAVDPRVRRANEEDRWSVVEKRFQAEMTLVEQRERLEKVIASIQEDEHRYVDLEKEEALLKKRIETLESESKRRELARTLEEATKTRTSIANQLEKLSVEREHARALLAELGQKEAGYESQSEKLGELEEAARSAEELRRLATERYKLEKERHEIEQSRWKAEDEIALLEAQYQTVAAQLAEAQARQVEIERKIRALSS